MPYQLVTQYLPLVSFSGVVILLALSKKTFFQDHRLRKKSIQAASLVMLFYFPKHVTFHQVVFRKYFDVLIKAGTIAKDLETFLQIG